jgi:hypothetical protein
MIIRDFYFVAWLVERGYEYEVSNSKLFVHINSIELKKLRTIYNSSDKLKFDLVRKIYKQIQEQRHDRSK